ncbi:MAG: uroporphyrinogen-III C-methyltransferase [Acidimicrobiales bacterium]
MTVFLVGAGPGDPGLITVRGAELLAQAGAVVHDRLVHESLLAIAPPSALLHDVGKVPGGPVRQGEINALLVDLGRRHEVVVRLKGGDPYVFGRGGEEALALQAGGIAFEVVPGVSSVNGVLARGGIPVTHRGLATSFCVVTGHGADGSATGGPVPVDWEALARVGGTVVVLMGVAHRGEIAARLISGGRDPSTPVAVVERGTLPEQRTFRTVLGELAAAEIASPATIVIGAVAGLDLSSAVDGPLSGWRVIVTRSREQASTLSAGLRRMGATTVEVPTIEIVEAGDGGSALRRALHSLGDYDWLALTSANAVHRVFHCVRDARHLAGVKVAAVGPGTAEVLLDHGIVADLVPQTALAEEMAKAFGEPGPGQGSVLIPQAAGARDVLSVQLRAKGFRVETVEAYRTVHPAPAPSALAAVKKAHAVTFASSSTVKGFLASFGKDAVPPVVASIGPITSATARELGLEVAAEAGDSSVAGLIEALVQHAREKGSPGGSK